MSPDAVNRKDHESAATMPQPTRLDDAKALREAAEHVAGTYPGMANLMRRCSSRLYHDSSPRITHMEMGAVYVALEELRTYLDVVGDEADLDDEEMPQGVLRDVVARLDRFFARVDRGPSV